MGTHFRRQPPGLPLFAHSHSHTLSRRGTVVQPQGLAGSGQVLHHKEHDHTGEQHPTDHEVLVLESSLLDEPHHCVGQAEHIGNVEELLLGPLGQTRRGRNKDQLLLPRMGECHHEMGLYQQTVSWSCLKHTRSSSHQKQITLLRPNDFWSRL